MLLSVNDQSLKHVTHADAVTLLKNASGFVTLEVVSWPGTFVWALHLQSIMSHHIYFTCGTPFSWFMFFFFFFLILVGHLLASVCLWFVRQYLYLYGSTKFKYSYQIWQVDLKWKWKIIYRNKTLFWIMHCIWSFFFLNQI